MWTLIPAMAKIRAFFSDFTEYPYQAGSSLNASGINYHLLQQDDAMKRLKAVESLHAA